MKKIALRLFICAFISGTTLVPALSYAAATLPTSETTVPSNEIVDNALREFKSLSKQERKARLKEARKAYRDMKANGTSAVGSTPMWVQVVLAILLPPLAVYLHEGEINNKFWIDLILTLLFFIPGVIYALIVVLGGA